MFIPLSPFSSKLFFQISLWMSSCSLLSNFLRNLPSPIIIQTTVTHRESWCSNYVTCPRSMWTATLLPVCHFWQFLPLMSLTHIRSLELKRGRATSDPKNEIKNVHLLSWGMLSVLSFELRTVHIVSCLYVPPGHTEKQRLEKETMKHKNGNFYSFYSVSKLPVELIQVKALGRPFTINEAF